MTLTAPNIVLQCAPVTNPSSCMMSAMTEVVLEDEGEMTHDCVTLTYAPTSESNRNSHRECRIVVVC